MEDKDKDEEQIVLVTVEKKSGDMYLDGEPYCDLGICNKDCGNCRLIYCG